jgi:hypothetical protein
MLLVHTFDYYKIHIIQEKDVYHINLSDVDSLLPVYGFPNVYICIIYKYTGDP